MTPTAAVAGSLRCVVNQRNPFFTAALAIAVVVITAPRGRPAPNVLLKTTNSGTMPSRWNAHKSKIHICQLVLCKTWNRPVDQVLHQPTWRLGVTIIIRLTSGSSASCLGFVYNQIHASFLALGMQSLEIAQWQVQHSSSAQNRLYDESG